MSVGKNGKDHSEGFGRNEGPRAFRGMPLPLAVRGW